MLALVVVVVVGRVVSYTNAPEVPVRSEEPTASVQPTTTAEVPETYVRVLVEGLKLREGPARTFGVLRELTLNESLAYIGETNGWYHVRDASGLEGWCASGPSYSEKVGDQGGSP